MSITDTRDDTNVLSNSEPTTANNIRDVNITCSTAATMSGITFGDAGATNTNMYPIPGATIRCNPNEGVDWDFNYSCLLTVASIIAGIGLAIDSSTTVISSMLLSLLGMSYGLIIWDIPLIKQSMKNELLSIMYIIIFGFLIGKFDDSSSLAWAHYCIRHF